MRSEKSVVTIVNYRKTQRTRENNINQGVAQVSFQARIDNSEKVYNSKEQNRRNSNTTIDAS